MSVSVGGGRPDGALQSDVPRPDPGGAWFLVCSSAHRTHTRPIPPVRVVVVVVAVKPALTWTCVSRRPDLVNPDVSRQVQVQGRTATARDRSSAPVKR